MSDLENVVYEASVSSLRSDIVVFRTGFAFLFLFSTFNCSLLESIAFKRGFNSKYSKYQLSRGGGHINVRFIQNLNPAPRFSMVFLNFSPKRTTLSFRETIFRKSRHRLLTSA